MPRIFRIEPSAQVGQPPSYRASAAEFGGLDTTTAQAAHSIAQTSLHGLDTLRRVEKQLQEEDAKLDIATKMGALKTEFATREAAIRDEGVEPKDYQARVTAALNELAQQTAGQLKYPGSAPAFQRQLAGYLAEEKIKALHTAVKLQHAQIETMDAVLSTEDANAAVFGLSQQDRQEGYARGLARIEDRVRRGIYSPDQGASKLSGFLRDVELGGVKRDWNNPETRGVTISNLLTGAYKHVAPEAQLTLARTLQQQAEADRTRDEAAAQKALQESQREVRLDLIQRASEKTLSIAELQRQSRQWQLHDTDYQRILGVLQAPVKEPESDATTLRQVIADTHSQVPRMRESDLNALKDAGQLNTADWKAALDRLVSTTRHNQEYGHTLVMQQHSQAEQELMKSLGVITPFAKLDPVQEKIIPFALRELRLRSNAYPGGTEAPLMVLDATLPRWQKALDDETRLTIEQIRKVALYPGRVELQRARDAKQISQTVYEAQRPLMDLLFDLIDKQEQRRLTAQRKGAAPSGRLPER